MKKLHLGFTLIELLVVIVVVGIITAIAASLYSSYALQGRRADGINAILAISMLEEKYRANNTAYGTLAQIGGSGTSPQGFYTITVTGTSATAYTITATAVGNQANDTQNGVACSTLTLTVSGGTTTQTPTACWPS